jgi:hypothetical protein
MRDINLEASIWNLFSSVEFFEAAADECEKTMAWFGTLAISRNVADFGRNNQIFDTFKTLAFDFRRGAKLAGLGDYRSIWEAARCVRGDARGMMEQPLHSWMADTEYREFSGVRLSRLLAYASQITHVLNNAFVGADSFFDPDPDCPEGSNDDGGFPGDAIVETYNSYQSWFEDDSFAPLPDPLPEYVINRSVVCLIGDEVPWTGVWYPAIGMEGHSLTFAIKGLRMQPAYRVTKTVEERERESGGAIFGCPETAAVETTWHPVIPSGRLANMNTELREKAGEPCPKAGIWQPMESGAAQRSYEAGEAMANLGSAYGITVWRWIAER